MKFIDLILSAILKALIRPHVCPHGADDCERFRPCDDCFADRQW